MTRQKQQWLDQLQWDEHGLIPAIAQDSSSGKILMFAWMNRASLQLTRETGKAVYWSRSRKKLWQKGEQSGHSQIVKDIRTDCDKDVLLLQIEQIGGIACHTGRQACFYHQLDEHQQWQESEPVLKDPKEIY